MTVRGVRVRMRVRMFSVHRCRECVCSRWRPAVGALVASLASRRCCLCCAVADCACRCAYFCVRVGVTHRPDAASKSCAAWRRRGRSSAATHPTARPSCRHRRLWVRQGRHQRQRWPRHHVPVAATASASRRQAAAECQPTDLRARRHRRVGTAWASRRRCRRQPLGLPAPAVARRAA